MDQEKFGDLRNGRDHGTADNVTRFFVLSGGGGDWLIYHEGVMNPIESQHGKNLAVENAKSLAKLEAPSEVLVEQRNGTFKLAFAWIEPHKILQT